jgi:peptidoglycan hydrolase CwlO-like protein
MQSSYFQEETMTSNSDVTLSGRIAELENKLAVTLDRVAKTEATIEQLNKSIAAGNRMTNWQFIGFVVVMAGTLFSTMFWSTGVLERRVDQMERNMNTRFEEVNRRFDDVNRRLDDTNRGIESLRQIMLTQQKR